jgi:YD repeat-containing protein
MGIKNFQKLALFVASAFILSAIVSCSKLDAVKPKTLAASDKQISSVSYTWGDMSLSRQNQSDVVAYNNEGRITSLTSADGGATVSIAFTYQDNKIILNTPFADTYQLDNQGRVTLHTATHNEPDNFVYTNTEQYTYDNDGYLKEVDMAGNGLVYSVIKYQVSNGNYTSYVLADPTGANVTRQYDFSYSNTAAVSAFEFFTPVLGNNTYNSIEKYLNFGKQSANLLSGINYKIADEGGAVQTGALAVTGQTDASGNITQLTLTGAAITGMPLDNLSPFPRSVTITYTN